MIAFILKVSLCWLFFYGIYELFLKNKTFFNANRSYLLITLAAGIILPLLEFIPWKNESNVAHVIYPMLMEIDELQTVVVSRAPEKFNWSIILYIIYGIGFTLSMFRFSMGIQKIVKLFSSSTKLKNDGYTLVMTDEQHLPFSFFKWVFFSKSMTLSDEVDRILTHEIEHIKGKHSIDVLATELLKVVFWCSPMIYLYRNALKEVHEFLADHVVINSSDKLSYKKLLLNQTNNGLQMALTHQFFNSHLKNRLKMISQKRSGRPTLVMYALGIPVLLLLLFAFTYAIQPESEVLEDTSYPSGMDDKAFDYITYADETNQSMMPYIQVNGEDIDYPLSDHIDVYGKVGTICTYVQEYATEMYGEKAKLGYINLQDPTFKKENWNPSIARRIFDRFQAKKDTVPSSAEHIDWDKAEIFKVVEQMPRFPGCETMEGDDAEKEDCAKQKMLEYIYTNLKYPKEDREQGIQGMAVAQFVITSTGDVKNLKIIRSISDGTDQSVMAVLKNMNNLDEKWIPGYQRGKAVNVLYTLPVRFKLQEDENKKEVEDKNLKIDRHSTKGVVITDSRKGFDVKGPDFQIAFTYSPIISSPAIFVNDEMWFGKLSEIDLNKMEYFEFTHPRPTRQASGKKTAPVFNFTTKEALNVTALKIDKKSSVDMSTYLDLDLKEGQKIAYIVDGKLAQKSKVEKLSPDQIVTVNVMKADLILLESNMEDYDVVIDIVTKAASAVEEDEGLKGSVKDAVGNHDIASVSSPASKKDKIVIGDSQSGKEPLFIVDGKEKGPGNMDLDPDDIATINILKDEAAHKKYGDKAINGVVEITTKKGQKEKEIVDFDTPAYFPGCKEEKDAAKKDQCSKANLLKFIYSNVKYPTEARLKGIEGMIVTKFIIGEEGKINEVKILRGVDGLSKAAMETVSKMADEIIWEPAMKNGKAVAMEFTLPIKFKLPEEAKQVEPVYTKCDQIEDEKLRAKCKEESKAILEDNLEELNADTKERNTLDLEKVLVYPNPAKESIKIKFTADPKPIKLQIFTVEGRNIFQKSYPNFSGNFDEMIDIKDVKSTFLLVKIEQEGKIFTEKIIVE